MFLDTKSNLVGDTISVYLCTKPTDTHQYLLPTSCHPQHSCKNIPYSLALRLRRICFDSDTFESRARELTDHLCKRGYQKLDISLAIERARQQKREDLLSYRPKSESNILPFVLTYHLDLPKVRDIVNNTGPSLSLLAHWARSLQKDRPWPTEDPRVCGIFLYVPSSNQTCVIMNHLGRHDRAAK